MDDGGSVACHRPCASRLALVGPLLSSAKQQDRVTRANAIVLLVNSSADHDGGYSA